MKIRINQDVTFIWKLTVGGESVDLSKLELSVEITTPSNKKTEITPNIQFDTLEFNYRPKQVGEYILSAYLNRFKDGETALDIKAFEGVKYSWNQGFSPDDNLEANYVELAGDFNAGANGSVDLSDYAKKSYVDTQINGESTARVQADSELQSKINTKQDKIIAGTGIDITNNTISCTIDTVIFKVVDSLPASPSMGDENKIHLVLSSSSEEGNAYDEYLWANNSWEKIGSFIPSVDLSMYAEKSYVDTQINGESTARVQADSELQSKINTKQDKIIAGTGIDITNNTISCTIDTVIFKVVDSLPASPSMGDENKIHLVLSSSSEEGNAYDEYLWANNSWEKIGSFIPSVDLSDYAKKSYVDTKASYIDTQINNEVTARTQADSELQSKINSKQDTLTAGENIKIENNVISAIGGGTIDATELSVKITWAELKALRDNSQLVAGQQYRITDYTCTTTQGGTKSAGHVFDIIVTADSESVLNEEARAIQHDGDTYFANCDLNAWKIWYCIDNDTNRFAWADTKNGKGVIYRMIDDLNNDIPYDFKNIQFYRQWDEDKQLWCTIPYGNTDVPCYTFSSNGDSSTVEFTDMSLSASNNVYSNVIKEYINIGKQALNNNCFFGNSCYLNSFGSNCYFNSFGTGCDTNTFGCRCNTNSFGYGCSFNTFGNKFEYNSFGTYCLSNSFGNDCSYNSLDDTCFGNSFGNKCVYNSIGESCSYNSFGNGCSYIKFAPDSSATTKYGYYQNNHFGDGCEYIVFTGAESVLDAREIHNYNFAQGLQGTANNYLIVEGKRNRSYETYISKSTNGTIKESVIAEKQDKLVAGAGINITDNTISCTLDTTVFTVVNSLPVSPSMGDENKIHLVLSSISGESNSYDEYLWVNNSWEKIGSYIPSVDLSMYAEKSYVDSQINNEVTARTQADAELQSQIDSKQDTLTAGENIRIENNVISAIGGGTTGATELSVKITWSELKSLRDNSQLVAGQQYRITDYTCTTTQPATKSAGHVFDIIVTADSESVLNEEARAIQHDGDTYFANCNLNAWKIWYRIDNDTNRFAWADSTNGKGVIYRMIDDFGNDCPYDFKNIQFYRKFSKVRKLWCTIPTDNTGVPCYTFSSSGDSSTASFTDMSLSTSNDVYSNVIKEYIKYDKQTHSKQNLNNICFFGLVCNENIFGVNCYENTFGSQCMKNSFGSDCYRNSFRNDLWFSSFGNRCENNSFGSGCSYNTFGDYLTYNTFGDDCEFNSFGGYCTRNSFGNGCQYNSFGNYYEHNSVGNYCRYNSFGNRCYYIKFASDSAANTKYTFYQNNHFGDGCWYILFTGAETASSTAQVQNYKFAQGLQGTDSAYLTIDGKRGRAYETKVAKNSSGTLKIYCEADLIQ